MSDREFTVDTFSDVFGRETSLTYRDGETRSLEASTQLVVAGLLALSLLSLIGMFSGSVLPAVVRVPFVVLGLTFVPGSLVVLLVDSDAAIGARQVLYAYGTSLLILMFVGAGANIFLPSLGIETPLTPIPLAGAVTLTVGVLSVATLRRDHREAVVVRVPQLWAPAPLGLLAVPLVTALSVVILNVTGFNLLLLLALSCIAALPMVAIRWIREDWYAFGVWTMALAIVLHKSLWRYSGFGGRPHGINAWKAGRWSPGILELSPYSSELLPTGVLFPMYAHLADVFILTEYEVINPFLVSLIPVAIFVAVRPFVDADQAFLAAAFFAFAHPFYLQYPTAGRAASPVIFLALFAITLSDDDYSPMARSLLAVSFLLGVVVSHYGTSYLVTFALSLGVLILFALTQIDTRVTWRSPAATDGGVSPGQDQVLETVGRRFSVFSPLLAVYFGTATLAWYLYMRGGWKFQLLVNHVQENLQQAANVDLGGRTAARVVKNYGAVSIELAKIIYILAGLLMVVGLLVVFYRRMVTKEMIVNDQYFAIAGSMFAIFGMTFVFRNWGGGRPMMITFVFTTVFAVIGIVWLADRTLGYGGRETFAVLLAALFVLNSGVAAATVFGGIAATNVPLQPQLADSDRPEGQSIVHRDTDTATHLWIVRHGGEQKVYADTFGARQYDWFRPILAAKTPIDVEYGANKPSVTDPRSGHPDYGYVLILGHNEKLQRFWPAHSRFDPGVPITDLRLSDRHRVYTNGEGSIYSIPSAANTTAA